MKNSAAPARLALAPLLLVLTAGTAGFATGWFSRAGPPPRAVSTDSTPPVAARAAVPADAAAVPVTAQSATRAEDERAAIDPAAARAGLVAWVEAGCPNGDFGEIEDLLTAWSSADPRGALDYVHSVPRFRSRTRAYCIPLAAIASAAPGDAITWIQREFAEESQRNSVAEGTIDRLLPDHPGPALEIAHADAIPVGSYHFARVLRVLARRDPPAALDGFTRLSAKGRDATAEELVEGWLDHDRPAATAWALAQTGTPHGSSALRGLLSTLGAEAPDELALVLQDPRVPETARLEAVRSVCYTRPEVAIDLLATLPTAKAGEMLDIVFDDLFTEDPAGAIEIGSALLAPEVLAGRVRREWSAWLNSDRPAALAWAANVSDPAIASQLAIEQRRSEVYRDPTRYLETLGSAAAPKEEQELVSLAIRAWADQDLDRATRWLAAHAAAATPARTSMLTQRLCRRDPAAALAWIQSLPNGPARDAAHAVAAGHCASRSKTDLANSLIAGITDPVLQTQVAYQTFRTLRENDEDAALRWLDTHPIPSEVRASWIAITPTRSAGGIPPPGYPY